jgi:hypothetical protein
MDPLSSSSRRYSICRTDREVFNRVVDPDPDPHGSALFFDAGSGSAIDQKSWNRICIKFKIQKLKAEPWRAMIVHNEGLENKIELWRANRPVAADSHHLEEELDPDPHKSEMLNPDPH